MDEHRTFTVDMERVERFRFEVSFDDASWAHIRLDEPTPLGDGTAPNAVRLLGAAIGNCLAASLLFCLQRSRIEVHEMKAHVEGSLARNERGRLRVDEIKVVLEPTTDVPLEKLGRCLDLFEDFCVVTQSVREGIDVDVSVRAHVREAAGV